MLLNAVKLFIEIVALLFVIVVASAVAYDSIIAMLEVYQNV